MTYACCHEVCEDEPESTHELSAVVPFSYAAENAMEPFHVCHWDEWGHNVCHTEWHLVETEIDLEMVAFPLLTGGIGYEVDGARVSLPSEDLDMAFDYLVDTRESEPFVWSVGVTDMSPPSDTNTSASEFVGDFLIILLGPVKPFGEAKGSDMGAPGE